MKKFIDFVNDLHEKVADDSHVRFGMAVGQKALKLAAMIGQSELDGKLRVGATALGVAEVLLTRPEVTWNSVYKAAMRRHNGVTLPTSVNEMLKLLVASTQIPDPVFQKDGEMLLRYPLGGDAAIYTVVRPENTGLRVHFGYPPFSSGLSEGTDINALLVKCMEQALGEGAWYLKVVTVDYNNRICLTVEKTRPSASMYVCSDHDYNVYAERYKALVAKGLPVGNLFSGMPGTGKTEFCRLLTEAIGGRLLIISPNLFKSFGTNINLVADIVDGLKPSVLLFDDVDYVSRVEDRLMPIVDEIRQRNPEVYLIATVNNPKKIVLALQRPKRFGHRVDFHAPNKEVRRKVVEVYAQAAGADSARIIPLLEDVTSPRFTQDYIRDMVSQSLVLNDADLQSYLTNILDVLIEKDEEVPSKKRNNEQWNNE